MQPGGQGSARTTTPPTLGSAALGGSSLLLEESGVRVERTLSCSLDTSSTTVEQGTGLSHEAPFLGPSSKMAFLDTPWPKENLQP